MGSREKRWQAMILIRENYLLTIAHTQGDAKDRLKIAKCPRQVEEFMGYHIGLEHCPSLENVEDYGNNWVAWHDKLKAREDYEDMVQGGGNGIFLLVI